MSLYSLASADSAGAVAGLTQPLKENLRQLVSALGECWGGGWGLQKVQGGFCVFCVCCAYMCVWLLANGCVSSIVLCCAGSVEYDLLVLFHKQLAVRQHGFFLAVLV